MSQRPLSSGSYKPTLRVFQLVDWNEEDRVRDVLAAVEQVSGVKRAELNPSAGRLIVLGTMSDEEILAAVHGLGLEITVESPPNAASKGKPKRRWALFSSSRARRGRKATTARHTTEGMEDQSPATTPGRDGLVSPPAGSTVDADTPADEQSRAVAATDKVSARAKWQRSADSSPPARASMRAVITSVIIISFITGIMLSVFKMGSPAPINTIPMSIWAGAILLTVAAAGFMIMRRRPRQISALVPALGDMNSYIVAAVVAVGVTVSVSWWEGLLSGALIVTGRYAADSFRRRLYTRLAYPAAENEPVVMRAAEGDEWHEVARDKVVPGMTLRLTAEETNPADGRVSAGEATVSLEHINSDPIPVVVQKDMFLPAGAIVRSGAVEVAVEQLPENSLIRMLRRKSLIAETEANALKDPFGRWLGHFSAAVLYVAFAVMVVPLIFLGDALDPWVKRALGLLILAPATTISAARTLPVMASTVRATVLGMAVRSGQQLHELWHASRLVLTESTLVNPSQYLVEVHTLGHTLSEQQAVQRAASLVAAGQVGGWRGLVNASTAEQLPLLQVADVTAIPAYGVAGDVRLGENMTPLLLGHTAWLREQGIRFPSDALRVVEEAAAGGSYVLWLADGTYALAAFVIGKRAWDGSRRFSARLDRFGFRHITLVSPGDARDAERIGQSVHVDEIISAVTPEMLAQHAADWQNAGEQVVSIGTQHDYRAPFRTGKAHIWLGAGTHMPTDAKCITILDDDPAKVLSLFGLSKNLDRTDRWITGLAVFGKAILLLAAGRGRMPLWTLAMLDAGLIGAVIVSAWRLSRFRR